MKIDLSRFRDAFFEEAAEHAVHLERDLLRLEHAPGDSELLNAIFRAAHSIKGSAGYFGLDHLTRFTHVLESVLQRLRAGELEITRKLMELLLGASDMLQDLLQTSRDEAPAPAGLKATIEALAGVLPADARPPTTAPGPDPSASGGQRTWRVVLRPSAAMLTSGMDPLLVLRDLDRLGTLREVRADLSALPALEALDPEVCHLSWEVLLEADANENELREVFAFVQDTCAVDLREQRESAPEAATSGPSPATRAGAGRRAADPVAAATIRVPTERVDELINLVGELVISQSMVDQILDDLPEDDSGPLKDAVGALARNTRELQQSMMSVRMLPVATVFDRFPRVVRDLSAACGKQVVLRVSGEETELDKSVIEIVADPLMHLVRNAVDHGIEPPDERRAAGKPEQGTIQLKAYHESGSVVIEVQDDGKGLDTSAIRAKAVEQGMLADDDDPPDDRLHALILQPGFSTARQVTDVSGRGVGMDVVSRNIERINGSLAISSTPGQGTRLRVRLPLTLAILDTLSVSVAGQAYLLPLLSVVESVQPGDANLESVLGAGEVLRVRGEHIPVLRLRELLATGRERLDARRGLVVIVEHEGRHLGLLVDALLGQRQAVIKSIEQNYRKVTGLMGATILGDGAVAFILDVNGLARLADARRASPAQSLVRADTEAPIGDDIHAAR